ncbi:MAG: site-specific tyrosine recombinase XerD [Ornithinimicrobium sp.]
MGHAGSPINGALRRDRDRWLDHLTIERGLAPLTVDAYRRDSNRYLDFLMTRGARVPADVDAAAVKDFLGELASGTDERPALASTSLARTLAAVRSLHSFWEQEAITSTDPAAGIARPAPPRALPHTLSLDDVTALLDAFGAEQGPARLRDKALLELLYGCGARVSEAMGLDIDDIDLGPNDSGDTAQGADAHGLASVRLFGKGSKTRIVPLGSYAVTAVQAYLVRGRPSLARAGKGSPALFLNRSGGRLSRQSVFATIRASAERAGLNADISPHTLRHCYATHLLDGGADIRVVQELLGHASVTTTQIYTHVTVEHLREVYAGAHPRAR